MIINATNLQALRVQFEAKFQEGFENTPLWSPELSTEIGSSADANLYGWLENSLSVREWLGERELQTLKENEYRLKNKHFEGSCKLNRDRIADDTLDMFVGVELPMFAETVAKWDDLSLASILLNNATAYDGLPFFDEAGAVRTYTNSGNLELQADGINFAATRAAMRKFVDVRGIPRYVGNQFVLVVPPDLERIARVVVEAEWNTHASDQHATNVQKGMAKVLVIEELTNPDRWFLAATGRPIKPFIVQNRQTPNLVAVDNPANGGPPFHENTNVYGVDFRRAYGVSFPWLMYANDPDGAMT